MATMSPATSDLVNLDAGVDVVNPAPVAVVKDFAASIANFRPTSKEVISGIAPHVFDERRSKAKTQRRRAQLNKRPATAPRLGYDFYHTGLAGIHGTAGPRRRSSFDSITSCYTTTRNWGTSPLRVSAVITVEDIDSVTLERKSIDACADIEDIIPQKPSSQRKRIIPRLELTLGKRKPNPTSPTPPTPPKHTKPKWRIDIRVFKSIGSKFKSVSFSLFLSLSSKTLICHVLQNHHAIEPPYDNTRTAQT
ncbi:hypothetical protein BDP27DRAFT_1416763 [Rhodocollybia butyracea]|uniref:Uncharacterized protein n=1 Tax=Rhodocollybia butyracea TaxID=206335 RepID=A0A9P5UCF9_9AGAR|nr:hypothetical protein BDP27DRAFT_1416763 [Rhodocollybia butyracea]